MEKDDDYIDEGFTDWKFHSLLCELEANGTILQQWENGEPIDNAPTEQKPMRNEKRNIIQR